MARECPQDDVSIHAHQFHSGRRRLRLGHQPPRVVSIHAHQFHSGRRAAGYVAKYVAKFQSTPTNFTAGDFGERTRDAWTRLFQSTPTNFTAGDPVLRGRLVLRTTRFNPRPPISQRATPGGGGVPAGQPVSIHAHQFHSGRPAAAPSRCSCRPCRFNPRPPISQRATPGSIRPIRPSPCFNPRPPISQRATPAG